MNAQSDGFLLVDSNWDFSLELVAHIQSLHEGLASNIIIAGDNTKQMLKMMFNEQIKDYCYCDFDNEISVSELATYLHRHHNISAVLLYSLDYHLASEEQRFIFDSLHPHRFLIEQSPQGFTLNMLRASTTLNHLSCHPNIVSLPAPDLILAKLTGLLCSKEKVLDNPVVDQ
ncbi:hypothetical protein HUZ36_16950 [Pseudoalteromonas sp. McH1-7]|uniref:Uncharacterized protein n=1 Tax=Pseudoalteromonas peptidolytica F12-50-A1 TaxID=1315280 RepID=A0A8I0MYA5_9GAMM|nr:MULTISPECIES: hypothetical protein [Pseudoalteromonas]MBE0347471.1 hypothetical protein [Pseudoalteromonas peptidolytica F12-50-A1]MDW7549566.1 hypothetical protein [Pseudoalteromonas peptidolytica]NLR13230.1 hypothetical protein [Pseudoalteromonas peptidolytica]NUZ12475.1 hypothetical protein [Pseudoalteromonas sp. McH1-7]RXF03515.1 hypothetical protein D9603_08215 [Pseudoalteromonas sp. PS5]